MNLGDDDAGEMSAVRSKIQPMKPSDQEIATDDACSHYPYRDWCRACFRITGEHAKQILFFFVGVGRVVSVVGRVTLSVSALSSTKRRTKQFACGEHGLRVLH